MTDIYYYRFRVLIVALRDYEKSIVEFREQLVLVENKSKNLSWAKSVVDFLNHWSAENYYKQYPEEALEIINLCQKIIYKYKFFTSIAHSFSKNLSP